MSPPWRVCLTSSSLTLPPRLWMNSVEIFLSSWSSFLFPQIKARERERERERERDRERDRDRDRDRDRETESLVIDSQDTDSSSDKQSDSQTVKQTTKVTGIKMTILLSRNFTLIPYSFHAISGPSYRRSYYVNGSKI